MSAELDALYQEVILDHNRKPKNFREIANAQRSAEGKNPLCGDQFRVFVNLDGDKIADVSFTGTGCAISRASASIMTATVKGKSVDEAGSMFEKFHALVTGKFAGDPKPLGQMAVFSGVSKYPVRVKCASLSWHTLRSALEGRTDPVTTDERQPL